MSSLEKLRHKFNKIDIFGETISFNIRGANSFKTTYGAIMTLAVLALTISYAQKRLTILLDYGDTRHLSSEDPDANAKTSFTFSEMDFNFAFGVFPLDWIVRPVNTTGYLEMKAKMFKWNTEKTVNGTY